MWLNGIIYYFFIFGYIVLDTLSTLVSRQLKHEACYLVAVCFLKCLQFWETLGAIFVSKVTDFYVVASHPFICVCY